MQRRRIRETVATWATALMLLAPVFAHAGEWQTYLHEDFSSAQTMFYTGPLGTAYYGIDETGRYVVDGLSAPGDSMAILTDSLYYYYFEAECEVLDTLAGDLASCGVVFHYNKRVRPGQNSYYVFYVYADGYYGVKRVVGDSDGNVDILIPLAKTEMIDPNYPNVLAVDAQGSRFDLYINGKYVDGFTDLSIDGGGFGFYSTKQTKAAYDNFSVKIERRDLGRDNLAQPTVNNPGESTQSGFTYDGYSPPVITKDPNRPLYPWEVGYVEPVEEKQTADEPVAEEDPNSTQPLQSSGGADTASVNVKPPPSHPHTPTQPNTETEPVQGVVTPPAAASGTEDSHAAPVKTHSYGDFGYDDNTQEVKLVSVDSLKEPAIADTRFEHQVTEPVAKENTPASIEKPDLMLIDTPQIDIRPDWLVDSGLPKNVETGRDIVEPQVVDPALAGRVVEPYPPTPEITPAAPVISKPAKIEESPEQEIVEPKEKKPILRRSTGIGGNDDYWDEDPVDTRDYKKGMPKNAAKPESSNDANTNASDPVQTPADHGDAGSTNDGMGDTSQLSLFPTIEETTPEVETQLVDTSETASSQDGQPEPQRVDIFSFREASANTPTSNTAAADRTTDKQPNGNNPIAEVKLVNPVKLAETPVVETEVVVSTSDPAEKGNSQTATLTEIEPPLPLYTSTPPPHEAIERPQQQPQITIIDDFSEQTWPVGDNGISSYRYFGAAYEIDNRMADTMAISFQQNSLASAQYSVESEFLDGLGDVGYGLAAHFEVNGGNASYYGLFISHSGEYLLLKVIGGKEKILVDWTPCNLLKPTMPNVISLEIDSPSIQVFINGKLITTMLDSSLRSGGYALLAGPGVAARFDNLVVNGNPRQ